MIPVTSSLQRADMRVSRCAEKLWSRVQRKVRFDSAPLLLHPLLLHVLLFVIRFASGQHVFIPDNKQIITLRNIIGPPSIAGGGSPKTAPKHVEIPKPKPQPIPFPDPTPDDPEPLYQTVPDPAPEIIAQIGTELSIGEISGPPGPGGYGGRGKGPGVGDGPGGPGDGVYTLGGGVRPPIPVNQPLPLYTEEARKAK